MADNQRKESTPRNDRPRGFLHWLRTSLGQEVDGAGLGLYRIVWGALMIVESLRKLSKTTGLFSPDYFHFKYALFPWIDPLPANWMMVVLVLVMAASAALVMLGLWFRFAAILFAILYTYVFLIEKVYFNNHFYLTSLLAILLCFTEADTCYSLKNFRRKKKKDPGPAPPSLLVPMWNYVVLRGQIIIVYFFGGIAKLNPDWLVGEPIRHWFATKQEIDLKAPIAWFPEILTQDWFVWLITYGGLLFDLSVGFLLLSRRTFWPAVVMLLGFHVTNNAIFKIGIFPFLGMGLIAIFFRPEGPRRFFHTLDGKYLAWRGASASSPLPAPPRTPGLATPLVTALVTGYLLVHTLLPFRWIAYGGQDASWTEVGHYFAWRMMLRDKDGFVKFYFNPPEAERFLEKEGIAPRVGGAHIMRLVKTPHFLIQYVHELDRIFRANGMNNVEIRAVAIVSLNGRPYQLMVDPTRDLSKASYGFLEVPDWIVPLEKNGRAGMYPDSAKERQRQIEIVFKEKVLPVLKDDHKELPLFLSPKKEPPASPPPTSPPSPRE